VWYLTNAACYVHRHAAVVNGKGMEHGVLPRAGGGDEADVEVCVAFGGDENAREKNLAVGSSLTRGRAGRLNGQ
jgi:hypothetical protein